MKKLILTLCLSLFTLFSFSQFRYNRYEKKLHPFAGMGFGVTHLKETLAHIEAGFSTGEEPKMLFAVVADVYKSKKDLDREWSVTDIGPRFYCRLYNNDIFSVYGYGELRYTTMDAKYTSAFIKGTDELGWYNSWYGGMGASASFTLINDSDNAISYGLLKFDVGYGATDAGRIKAAVTLIAVF